MSEIVRFPRRHKAEQTAHDHVDRVGEVADALLALVFRHIVESYDDAQSDDFHIAALRQQIANILCAEFAGRSKC
jgi:hypothetical protein